MNKIILKNLIEKPITGEWGTDGDLVNVLRTTNFRNDGTLDFENVVTRDISTVKVKQKVLRNGDIIIEKSGGSPNQPVGRVVYFENEGEYLCNNFTSILRPKINKLVPRYLFYILFANHKFGITNKYQNKTTGIINLQLPRYIENIQIPLPSLPEQQSIAKILDAADSLRKKTQQIIDSYDELAQSIFLDMFGDTWINQKGWKIKLIEDVAANEKYSIKAGPFGSSLKKEFYVDSGYKIYGQEQVIRDDFDYGDYYIDEAKYQTLKSNKIKSGDILISLVGTYGKISVVPEVFEPGIINPRLMKITPNKNIIRPDFLKVILRSEGVKIQMENLSRGGTMDIVNVGIMRKIRIPVPPLKLQNEFAEKIELIEKQKELAKQSLKDSKDLFNSLLQKAFKGELRN